MTEDEEEKCPNCGEEKRIDVIRDHFPYGDKGRYVEGQGYKCLECNECWCTADQIKVILARIYEQSGIRLPMPPESLSYENQKKNKPKQ